jgi:hypothetical protein
MERPTDQADRHSPGDLAEDRRHSHSGGVSQDGGLHQSIGDPLRHGARTGSLRRTPDFGLIHPPIRWRQIQRRSIQWVTGFSTRS